MVEKEIIKTVEVEVPGKTVTVTKEVIKEVMVPGKTVVVEKEVLKVVEVRQGYVTDPTTGKVVTAPEYGGTLTYARTSLPGSTDTWFDGGFVAWAFVSPVLEKLSVGNCAIDREEHGWNTASVPVSALNGAVAESWLQPDPLTYVFNIRRGQLAAPPPQH